MKSSTIAKFMKASLPYKKTNNLLNHLPPLLPVGNHKFMKSSTYTTKSWLCEVNLHKWLINLWNFPPSQPILQSHNLPKWLINLWTHPIYQNKKVKTLYNQLPQVTYKLMIVPPPQENHNFMKLTSVNKKLINLWNHAPLKFMNDIYERYFASYLTMS